jgi:O-methyltransferase
MHSDPRAERVIESAQRQVQAGRAPEAAALLQTLVNDLARSSAHRDQRRAAFEMLIDLLQALGRDARLSKVFQQYAGAYAHAPDAEFDRLYVAGLLATRTSALPLRRRDRFHWLIGELDKILALEGAVAECGCYRGLSSYLICSRLKQHRAAFDGSGYQIYDSFQGLSAPQAEDSGPAPEGAQSPHPSDVQPGRFSASLAEVKRALAAFPGVEYFPGWIPQAFPATSDRQYRFVHVDVDLYRPTRDSFEYFWPRLVPGGVMVCDDYNWTGARRAVEEFCGARGARFQPSPFNQAVIYRPR